MTAFVSWPTSALIGQVVYYKEAPSRPDRDHLERATAARAELFSRLSTPKSIKVWKGK